MGRHLSIPKPLTAIIEPQDDDLDDPIANFVRTLAKKAAREDYAQGLEKRIKTANT